MQAYYNENDKYCVRWLSNLIREGLIPSGVVDDRPIQEVEPTDLTLYTQCHFFAGIAGWSRALQLAEWPTDRTVWTGSCPCQPFSVAGNQKGFSDERHLWPYFKNLIEKCQPATVFGEQVAAAVTWLSRVHSDLEALDYAVGAIPIEAACTGSPQYRDRFWFVASRNHTKWGTKEPQRDFTKWKDQRWAEENGYSSKRSASRLADDDQQRKSDRDLQRSGQLSRSSQNTRPSIIMASGTQFLQCPDGKYRRLPPPGVRWLGNGIPSRVAKLRAFGNAIEPQTAAIFIKSVM